MKVLVVEDEPKLAGFIKKGLEEQSWEVEVAYDGQVGSSFALSNHYDVIVLDVNLPKINGFEPVSYTHLDVYKRQTHQWKFGRVSIRIPNKCFLGRWQLTQARVVGRVIDGFGWIKF